MKFSNKLIGMALTAIAAGALIGCTNELNGPNAGNGNGQLKLVRTPEVIAWSGKQYLENTRSTADISSIAPALAQNIVPAASASTRDGDVAEKSTPSIKDEAVANDYFEVSNVDITEWPHDKKPSDIANDLNYNLGVSDQVYNYDKFNTDFSIEGSIGLKFDIYPILSSSTDQKTHDIGVFYFDENGVKHEKIIWHKDDPIEYDEETKTGKGKHIEIKKACQFGFVFTGKNDEGHEPVDTIYYTLPELNHPKVATTNSNAAPTAHAAILGEEYFDEIFSGDNAWRKNQFGEYADHTYILLEDWVDFDYSDFVLYIPGKPLTFGDGEDMYPDTPSDKCPNDVCEHGSKYHPDGKGGGCTLCPEDEGCNSESSLPSYPDDPDDSKCPNKKNGVGCPHDDVEHTLDDNGNWVCPDCQEDNLDYECNPCPNATPDDKDGCGHSGKHHDENGVCDECDEDPNSPCAPCPNENEDGEPACDHSKGNHHKVGDKWVCDDPNCEAPECQQPCPNAGKTGYGPDGCGHQHEDADHCDQCPDGQGCNKSTETPENPGTTPSNPGDNKHDNEVEVNFELVDSHDNLGAGIKDLASKLSIHVRCATDVEIKIPVPTVYSIASDDLYIFNEHYGAEGGYHGTYGGNYIDGQEQVLTYKLGDENNPMNVELHVLFVTPEQAANEPDPFKQGYIKVWTKGITQDVIDWCMEHNGDGINFEVWTYYGLEDSDMSRKKFEENYLDKSTIEFRGPKYPDYYINAFGYDYVDGSNGQSHYDYINPDDCHVTPVDKENYPDYKTGTHLNGTPYNDIYTRKGVTADDAHSNTTASNKGGGSTNDPNDD